MAYILANTRSITRRDATRPKHGASRTTTSHQTSDNRNVAMRSRDRAIMTDTTKHDDYQEMQSQYHAAAAAGRAWLSSLPELLRQAFRRSDPSSIFYCYLLLKRSSFTCVLW